MIRFLLFSATSSSFLWKSSISSPLTHGVHCPSFRETVPSVSLWLWTLTAWDGDGNTATRCSEHSPLPHGWHRGCGSSPPVILNPPTLFFLLSPVWIWIPIASRLVPTLRLHPPQDICCYASGINELLKTHPEHGIPLPKILQWLATGQILKSLSWHLKHLITEFLPTSRFHTRAGGPWGPSCRACGVFLLGDPDPVTGRPPMTLLLCPFREPNMRFFCLM